MFRKSHITALGIGMLAFACEPTPTSTDQLTAPAPTFDEQPGQHVRAVQLEAGPNWRNPFAFGQIIFSTFTPPGNNPVFGDEPTRHTMDISVQGLRCIGPTFFDDFNEFSDARGDYVLNVNGVRIFSFNTSCRYAAPANRGGITGNFATRLVFTDSPIRIPFDPQHDALDIEVVVNTGEDGVDPFDPPPSFVALVGNEPAID